ncbi:MAG TPA: VIT and VWA domain-containing protein, partial [Thermoguttaceae bacterium]|nr:VIT and VWA domain-containing protein [Thermoguttaceae bacterium]
TLVMRGLAAAVAATVVLASTLWFAPSTNDTASAFGKVLDQVASAQSLHLQITQRGKSTEAWAKPGQLRWNQPDGTYKIAHGRRLWSIDERANRATSEQAAYFDDEKAGLDLLALLDLPKDEHGGDEKPQERVQHEGVACDVYRIEIPSPNSSVELEAVVDASTRRLRSIEKRVRRGDHFEPIAKVELLAMNEPVDETLFVVGDTLTEDGRIGKISVVLGIVAVKPVMHSRWTPVCGRIPIKPGDWLRTDVRGANAAAVRLVSQVEVILGPGSLVELIGPNQIRVISGEMKVVADAKSLLEVLGPNEQKLTVNKTQIVRLDKEKLVDVENEPLWLRGFEGTTTDESLGSLVAKVDGRDVPLTVGYHKVSVDIRDQIARTVVEESFVNHTDGRLEGVFYFPLPQDASISGFGMWIGDELVEADVVEKQRAREIYETILRERRDPGLLEWTGGNIFKARVFPIFAHSEKRIKITYTQVLPLRENRYRYSYALQSELLKQFPLRELSLDVKISSAMPLASVTSPTHTTRIDRTKHSAHVEFSAQEYTPTRDFEVIAEIDGRQSPMVMIPHRRGDDGYFMLQLTPPSDSDGWQRDVLPDGEPLELLVLADTSASIDNDGRRRQAEFLAALLTSLTPEDKINLAACDVDCNWVFDKAKPANEKNIDIMRGFLDGRVSLGWTDLDKAFASAMKRCGPGTQVIYLGDGISTTTDGDPVALGKRLKLLFGKRKAACHAVALGSSFEPIVLKTIASLGGGSMRQIGGEKGPQKVALELLGEITRPGLRDLKVQFEGLRTARVYPEQLPNLAAGTQQILLGRYLPEGRDQSGRVIVTGMQGDEPIQFSTDIELKDAESGNSFIPRLWARMHLDELLEQGTSSTIKDEI